MINIEIENKIIQYISNQYRPRWISLNKEWKEYLLQRWNDCNNIKESYLRIKNNICEIPKCPICKNNCKFHGDNWIYDNTCGNKKCQSELRNKKSKKTKLERYGDENYNNIQKSKQTKLERYGDENYSNREQAVKNTDYKKRQKKIEKTCLEKYGIKNGGGSKQALEKIKNTCLKKYGVTSTWKINGVIEKSKQTKIDRYGDENYNNREKYKKTCIEKYNVDNVFKNKIIQNKYKQTCLNNWGVDHNWKIPSEHDLTHTPEAMEKKKITSLKNWGTEYPHQSKEVIDKVNNTKHKNHTFNASKIENESYNLLLKKYPDVIRHYKSNNYPFICDFYIPSIDLYIECNYHWTHGNKPFENTIEDNNKLNIWKNKNTKFYNIAINTWTIRDVNKRNISKQNNLNYIEFWNINELQEWLKKRKFN